MNDAKMKRIMRKGYNKLARVASRKFQYFQLADTGDAKPDDEDIDVMYGGTQQPSRDSGEWIDVYEPFSPRNAGGTLTTQLLLVEGKQAESYAAVWFSKHDLPLKTLVKVDGQSLQIVNKSDYSAYIGVYYYYLNGRDDHN